VSADKKVGLFVDDTLPNINQPIISGVTEGSTGLSVGTIYSSVMPGNVRYA